MTRKETLAALYKKYNLTSEDVFTNPSQGWTIITRGGIDKVQAAAGIEIEYDVISYDLENVVIKAKASMFAETAEEFENRKVAAGDNSWDLERRGTKIQTFGEAAPKNTRNGYPFAIAEKRAMSRAVLKLSGLYAVGVNGQDEFDDANKFVRQQQQKLTTGTL